MIVNAGSAQDIKASLDCAGDKLTVRDLKAEIAHEKANQNRKTVITMLERKLRKKQKEVGS